MKKLFLTSSFSIVSDHLKKILPALPKDLTVVFVSTAADVYQDKWYVKNDRHKLDEMGFKIIDLSLKGKSVATVERILKKADIIFVAGGNTFYLLQQARISEFAKLVPKFVDKGVIDVGSSAGSYLACPTIEVAGWKHQDRNIVGITDLTAMSLVPFLMSVHYKPEFLDGLSLKARKIKHLVKILTNEQALIVCEDKIELVGQGAEIKIE